MLGISFRLKYSGLFHLSLTNAYFQSCYLFYSKSASLVQLFSYVMIKIKYPQYKTATVIQVYIFLLCSTS